MTIDPIQGKDNDDNEFGYIELSGENGGYFFTWRENLRDTLRSIEPDQMDRPRRYVSTAALERMVRRAWRRRYGSCRADAIARSGRSSCELACILHG